MKRVPNAFSGQSCSLPERQLSKLGSEFYFGKVNAIYKYDLKTGERTQVAEGALCSCAAEYDGKLYTGDWNGNLFVLRGKELELIDHFDSAINFIVSKGGHDMKHHVLYPRVSATEGKK